jgi:hypothetical protein
LEDFVKEYHQILRYSYNGDEDSTSVPSLPVYVEMEKGEGSRRREKGDSTSVPSFPVYVGREQGAGSREEGEERREKGEERDSPLVFRESLRSTGSETDSVVLWGPQSMNKELFLEFPPLTPSLVGTTCANYPKGASLPSPTPPSSLPPPSLLLFLSHLS